MKTRVVTSRPSAAVLEWELRRITKNKKIRATFRRVMPVTALLCMAMLLALVFCFPVLQVHGNSMSPALRDGDILLCIKKNETRQGQIIAFYHNNKLLIKRIIATAGDTVDIASGGEVSVNGQALSEPHISRLSLGATDITLPCRVPWDHVFVLGDNRPTSLDSRSSQIGCVPRERILGSVLFRLWPLRRFGPILGCV